MTTNKNYTSTTNTSKFSTIWHWTNIATDSHSSYKHKLNALEDMKNNFDSQTLQHFLAALREVLRSARNKDEFSVRMKAIDLLVEYGNWNDTEWTLWLHEKRSFASFAELNRIAHYRRLQEEKEFKAEQEEKLKQHLDKLTQKTMERLNTNKPSAAEAIAPENKSSTTLFDMPEIEEPEIIVSRYVVVLINTEGNSRSYYKRVPRWDIPDTFFEIDTNKPIKIRGVKLPTMHKNMTAAQNRIKALYERHKKNGSGVRIEFEKWTRTPDEKEWHIVKLDNQPALL